MNILEIAHVRVPGVAQDLSQYLRKQYSNFTYIEHPFKSSRDVLGTTGTRYWTFQNGRQVDFIQRADFHGTEIVFWLRDIISSLKISYSQKGIYDLAICLDCLNTLSGLLLKMTGKVKYLVYYTIDLTDKRFGNRFLDAIYMYLDRICYRYSDEVWDVSMGIKKLRKDNGYRLDTMKEKTVPIGYYPDDFRLKHKITRNPYGIVYLGSLFRIMGIQLAIESMPILIRKFPELVLTIIGTGDYRDELLSLIKEKKIESHVKYYPYTDKKKIVPLLFSQSIAIAPYLDEDGSYKKYCDPTKIKEYFAADLPVVITDVPVINKRISKDTMGITIQYNKKEFVQAITKLISKQKFRETCVSNIQSYIKDYKWEYIFSNALNQFNLSYDKK